MMHDLRCSLGGLLNIEHNDAVIGHATLHVWPVSPGTSAEFWLGGQCPLAA